MKKETKQGLAVVGTMGAVGMTIYLMSRAKPPVPAYFTVSPEWQEVNSNQPQYEAVFTVTNTGGAAKTEKVQWWVMEGYEVISGGGRTITLSPGESKEYSIMMPHPGYAADRHTLFRTNEMDGYLIVHFY